MPRLTDLHAIRAILHQDLLWSAYALGDLAPGFFAHSVWYGTLDDPTAIVLALHLFEPPVLFLKGKPDSVRLLLEEMPPLPRVFFLARPDVAPVFQEFYRIEKSETMWRMSLEKEHFHYTPSPQTERLSRKDLKALRRLFADGEAAGEAPDFFSPAMLERGVYFGVREEEELIASAGTHLWEPTEGVGAIGNVYTRRDRRGRGLATLVTGAVAAELARQELPAIVLNVNKDNTAAKRVYEKLGFRPYCLYEEGTAVRK